MSTYKDASGSNVQQTKKDITATMPVERYATEYNMSHKNRGYALIFNHELFVKKPKRTGTNYDCEKLSKTFTKLRFNVRVHKDLPCRDIYAVLSDMANIDHSENDCIVIVVLSHGDRDIVYARDREYMIENLWSFFTADKCPSLAGKPKMFFIQACQGEQDDPGVILNEKDGISDLLLTYTIPLYADFLIACSTIPGYISHRNRGGVSCFIHSLCEQLENNDENYHILKVLTLVNQQVAIDFEECKFDPVYKAKQMPFVRYSLTRLLKIQKYLSIVHFFLIFKSSACHLQEVTN